MEQKWEEYHMSSLAGIVKNSFETVGYRAFSWFSRKFPGLSAKVKPSTPARFITAFVLVWVAVEWSVYLLLYGNPLLLLDALVSSVIAVAAIVLFQKTGFYQVQTWDAYNNVVFGTPLPVEPEPYEEPEEDYEDEEDEAYEEDEDLEEEDWDEEVDEGVITEEEPETAEKDLQPVAGAEFKFPLGNTEAVPSQEEAVIKGGNALTEVYSVIDTTRPKTEE